MTRRTVARRISVTTLADGAAHDALLDERGRVAEPLVVVELDAALGDHRSDMAAEAARSCDRLLIGIATGSLTGARRELASALDLTLTRPEFADTPPLLGLPDPEDAVALLYTAAMENPQAALALKQVLRAGDRDVPGALDVESFAYSTLLGGTEFARWFQRRGARPPPPPSLRTPVLMNRDRERLTITLNRPQRRNAYGRELRDALVEALRAAVVDKSITRVVLDGAGPSFSSGGDLDEFGTTPDLATAHYIRTRAGAGLLLHRLASRVEARVHGTCVGAGIELPAFGGWVVAHPGTTFLLPEVAMGLIPGAGGTVSIQRRIGRWRTLFMALSGRPVDAATALRWGLVDTVGTW